jgi:streptogramin lyase
MRGDCGTAPAITFAWREVCIVYDCLFPWTVGGGERWLRRPAEHLARRGDEVTYLTRRQCGDEDAPALPGIRVVAVAPREPLYRDDGRRGIGQPLRFGRGVLGHLLRHRRTYDVVHCAAFPLLLAARGAGGAGGHGDAALRRLVRGLVAGVLARVPRRRTGVDRPDGAGRLRPREPEGDRDLGGDPAPPARRGDARPYRDAAGPLRRRARIFGGGPERPGVLAEIRRLALKDRVDAPGFVTAGALQAALGEAACSILPSSREGYGMVLVESAALGTPTVVVAGEDNAAVDLVEPGVNGFVAPEAIADAVVVACRGAAALRASTARWFAAGRDRAARRVGVPRGRRRVRPLLARPQRVDWIVTSMRRPLAFALVLSALLATSAMGAGRLKSSGFSVPPGTPAWVAPGPDGNLWFTNDNAGNYIGRMTPSGAATAFPLPQPGSAPDTIVRGPDGALWFTERSGNRIGRISTAGQIAEFPLPNAGSAPRGIAPGPDGSLWFTEFGGGRIGRITTGGAVTEFPIPGGGQPVSIVRGPDGNMWFTAPSLDSIGRITMAGAITLFGASNASGPESLVVGPDKAIWFTEDDGDRIGRITTAGKLKEFQSGITPSSTPSRITSGPDGALWFTELSGNRVARITITGKVREFLVDPGSGPWGIATGADKRIWFAESRGNRLVRFKPPDLPGVPGTMTFAFDRVSGKTKFTAMIVTGIQRGAKLVATCKGRGCPGRKTVKGKRTVKLQNHFNRLLSPGARVEVRLTLKGLSPKIFKFAIRGDGAHFSIRCQPPGARSRRRCAS